MPLYQYSHLGNRDHSTGNTSDGDDQDRKGTRLALSQFTRQKCICSSPDLSPLADPVSKRAKTCTDDMDILDNEMPVDLWLNEGSDKEEITDLQARFQSIGKSLVEAGEMVLQQAGKDQGIWMRGMTWHDLTTKAMAVIEDFLRVMHRDEHSRLGHTWLKGRTRHTCQASLATLGSHHSSDWDGSSNVADSSHCESDN
ncbi:uncharacterized protein EI90DRAFT_3116098 [Cantharellus anzutake]|uniref:uncharacterized protein n=1 Tax=Cantharellus anzutake TaxID=1750568 RepID=UPI001905815F|nr:uncharacterized protein EI90DRAFT_3116098 [Cantharellus anzutake]KAF8342172.1 hypothetical protein EI90DRAFT_3116098 [Cantharellus anzutake]